MVLLLALAGCMPFVRPAVHPDPDTSAAEVLTRLERAGSFAFRLSFRVAEPLRLAADCRGVRVLPDLECWKGRWVRSGAGTPVELRAGGAVQYERDGSGWRKGDRGIESRIIEQVRAVFAEEALLLLAETRGRRVYSFSPRVPFLDPSQGRVFSGRLEADTRTGLPLSILCRDSGGRAEWRCDFGRFGRRFRVELPFVAVRRVVARPKQRLRCARQRELEATARQRFERLGVGLRIARRCSGLRFDVGARLPRDLLGLMLSQGRVEVWAGRAAGESVAATELPAVRTMAGDAARRVLLVRLLGANSELHCVSVAGQGSAPALECSVAPDSAAGAGRAFLVVDGRVIAETALVPGEGTVRFLDVGTSEFASGLAAVAAGGPLPVELELELSDMEQ
jgi:hypothetical protein